MSGNTVPFLELLLHGNRQLKILFFNDAGKLKPEAAYYFRWLQSFCYADRALYKINPVSGNIDPYATHVAAGRQEVWIEHMKRFNLDSEEIQRQLNQLKEDEKWLTKSRNPA